MSDHLVFLVGEQAPGLRRHHAEQLARELDRVTVIAGGPLPGTKSAAALVRDALERGNDVVELEDTELLAVYGVIDALEAPLHTELRTLREAIGRALEIPTS